METLTILFSGPVLPATLFLGLLLIWSLLALAGTVDWDLPGSDVDFDLDLDASQGAADGLAVLALKWLNLREIPLVLWLGTLAVLWWFLSATLWSLVDSRFFTTPGWLWSTLLVARNLALATLFTKWTTQPMTGWFTTEKLDALSLIGQECHISSSEATPEFGQVKYKTDGAPLLLNVRTDGPYLARGTPVWITHYDSKRRVYIVSPTTAIEDTSASTAKG
ncbi:MAG: NfeD family protein [Planctomycetales bacterium]|nr:NfeD family protein [Planctomycetales bacterium]